MATLRRTATTPTLRQTVIMATLPLLKATTPTLRHPTAIMPTLRLPKVTKRRQSSD
jgi:hypothetical protein